MKTVQKRSHPDQWKVGVSTSLISPLDLQEAKEAGIGCLELTFQSKTFDIRDPQTRAACDEFIRRAKEFGIDIWTLHIPYGVPWDPSVTDEREREQVVQRVSDVLKIAEEWGIRTAVYHPSWEPIDPDERGRRMEACKRTLDILAKEAAAHRVRLAVECLPRTCLGNSAEEMAEIVSVNADLGICCDVNHLFKESPEQFIRRLGSRIITTHISDNDGTDEKHWYPGDGILNWRGIIEALAEAGYPGPFLYEVRGPQPGKVADNWRQLLARFKNG